MSFFILGFLTGITISIIGAWLDGYFGERKERRRDARLDSHRQPPRVRK